LSRFNDLLLVRTRATVRVGNLGCHVPADSEYNERRKMIADLRSRAAVARRLVGAVTTAHDQRLLREFADELETKAAKLERGDDTRDPT
jgi:hypothetical protein